MGHQEITQELIECKTGNTRYVTYPAFSRRDDVAALTTMRADDPESAVIISPETILPGSAHDIEDGLGVSARMIAVGRQVHEDSIAVVDVETTGQDAGNKIRIIPKTDALITTEKGVILVVLSADCLPIFIYDSKRHAVGIVHTGWKGTEKRITTRALEVMRASFKSSPADMIAVIGPSIGPCCYSSDLWQANEAELRAAGVGSVINQRVCTRCQISSYYSYRVEGQNASRMVSAIALR